MADIAVISAMAYIIGKLKDRIRVPFGVNVVKNPIATIDLAAATGARFGRSCFSGAYMGEYGVYVSNSGEPSGTERLWEWSTLSSCLR